MPTTSDVRLSPPPQLFLFASNQAPAGLGTPITQAKASESAEVLNLAEVPEVPEVPAWDTATGGGTTLPAWAQTAEGDLARGKQGVGVGAGALKHEVPDASRLVGRRRQAVEAPLRPEPTAKIRVRRRFPLCCQLLESEGGMFGCTLLGWHKGAHELSSRRPHPRASVKAATGSTTDLP